MVLSRMRFQGADYCLQHSNDKLHTKKNYRSSYMKTVFAVKQSSVHGVWDAVHTYMMWRKMSEDANNTGSIDELLKHCNNIYISQPLQIAHAQQTEMHFMKVVSDKLIVRNVWILFQALVFGTHQY